jgi:predicted Zn-dependent protease
MFWLGLAHWCDARFGFTRNTQLSIERAERLVHRLESSPEGQSMANSLAASIHLFKGEHESAIRAARTAIEFAHGAGDRVTLGQSLMYAGEPAEAIKEIASAMRSNPHHGSWFLYYLSLAYFWNGDLERAVEVSSDYLGREPDEPFGYAGLAAIYAMAGRSKKAQQTVVNLLEKFPVFRITDYARAQHYKDPKQPQQVIQALREAGLPD